MFTWIIEKKAKILEASNGKFKIENIFKSEELNIWQSIAHDWACMTLESFNNESWDVFVMNESLKKTNFNTKKSWDYFNIERCMKLWDRLDWHMVSGHIDCIWKVENIENIIDGSKILKISFNEKFKNLIIEKWSITINWVSLTIIEALDNYFTISLIPLSQNITNLWNIVIWNIVNLEFDMIWKYVNRFNI